MFVTTTNRTYPWSFGDHRKTFEVMTSP